MSISILSLIESTPLSYSYNKENNDFDDYSNNKNNNNNQ